MRIISKPIIPGARALMSAAAISLIVISTATPVAAQVGGLFPWEWKWPGDSQSTSQTRHLTTFPRTARPGQIIVSFADRKLYYVHRSGEAIVYPIAIPRPEDRWQGVLKVSSKKVNPPWTPTSRFSTSGLGRKNKVNSSCNKAYYHPDKCRCLY